MASTSGEPPRPEKIDESLEEYIQGLVNRGGSFSSETISSRHARLSRVGSRAGAQSIATLARRLRAEGDEKSFSPPAPVEQQNNGNSSTKFHTNPPGVEPRLNRCFHYYRFLVVIFGGLSVGLMLLLRYNITISVLKMVNQTHLYLEEHPGSTIEDMIADGHTPGGEFNWNNEIQQLIMSWYMVAYTLPQVPMAKVGSMIGCRLAVPLALSVCISATLLTPTFAYLGWQYVILLRLVNGFGATPVLPLLINLLESWLREDEISLGLGIAQSLCVIVVAVNPLLSGYLSSIHWNLSFYVPAVITLVFCLMWLVLISDRPDDNPLVSKRELEYIYGGFSSKESMTEFKRKSTGDNKDSTAQDEDAYKADSWTAVLRVPSFWAYVALWCLHCSCYNAFNFVLPNYLIQFLKIKVAQNGFYCSIIQTGCIVAVIWPHPFLRLLQLKFKLSNRVARRAALAICCSIVGSTWIAVGVFHKFQLVLLFVNRCTHNGIDVIITSTLMLNYARAGLSSLAFSAVNTIGNLSVVFSSTFVGWFLDYTGQSQAGWCMIFVSLGLVQIIVWLLYAIVIPVESIKFESSTKKEIEDAGNSARKEVLQTRRV